MRRTFKRRRSNTIDISSAKKQIELHNKKELQDLEYLQDKLEQMIPLFKKFKELLDDFNSYHAITEAEHQIFRDHFEEMYGYKWTGVSMIHQVFNVLNNFFYVDESKSFDGKKKPNERAFIALEKKLKRTLEGVERSQDKIKNNLQKIEPIKEISNSEIQLDKGRFYF
jgi:hypothetical protein